MLLSGIAFAYKTIRTGVLFTAMLCFFGFQKAATQDSLSVSASDTGYYVSQSDQFSLYTYGIVKLNSFELKNQQGLDLLKYRPNENVNLGLGFNYKWLGIGTAFNFIFLNNDSEIYGKSSSVDLQGDIYAESTIFTVNAQTYKGFFLENMNDYDTS